MRDTTRPTITLPAGNYRKQDYLDCIIVLTEPAETSFEDCTFRLVCFRAPHLDLTSFHNCSWYDCTAEIEYAGAHATPHVLHDMNLHLASPCVMSESTAQALSLIHDPHAVVYPAGLWIGEDYVATARYYAHPHSTPAVATRSTEGVMWDDLAQWISDVRADLDRADSPYSMIELTLRQEGGTTDHVYLAQRWGSELWMRSSSVIGDARFMSAEDTTTPRYYVPMDTHRATIVRCDGYAPVVERDAERAVHLTRAMLAGGWVGEVLVLSTDGSAVYMSYGERLDTTIAEIEAHATECTCHTDIYGCPADAQRLLAVAEGA